MGRKKEEKEGRGGWGAEVFVVIVCLSVCLKKVPAISSTAGVVADWVQAKWLEAVCDCHLHSEKS